MDGKKRALLIASRPLEYSGLTKIEMDCVKQFSDFVCFDVACGFGFDNAYGKMLYDSGVVCITLPPKKKVFSYINMIRKVVKNNKYEFVYIHGNSSVMIMEALPSKMGGARVITHCHNSKPPHAKLHYYLLKPFFNAVVDCKIGCSKKASEWAYMGKNICTIINGIDTNTFYYNPAVREDIREELQWSNKKIVGHIGAFNKQKNHEKLIDIFHEMLKVDPNVRLLLIGSGENQNNIRTMIKDYKIDDMVRIIEHVQNPQDYYQAMDVFVFPSYHEGLPLVAVEAQSCGLPVLASDVNSSEVEITPIYKKISLSKSSVEWAQMALEMMKYERKDYSSLISEKGMDLYSMMSEIRKKLF